MRVLVLEKSFTILALWYVRLLVHPLSCPFISWLVNNSCDFVEWTISALMPTAVLHLAISAIAQLQFNFARITNTLAACLYIISSLLLFHYTSTLA